MEYEIIQGDSLLQTMDETSLYCAVQYGHTAVVSQLLEYASDPIIRISCSVG
jgi:hypothetical protein